MPSKNKKPRFKPVLPRRGKGQNVRPVAKKKFDPDESDHLRGFHYAGNLANEWRIKAHLTTIKNRSFGKEYCFKNFLNLRRCSLQRGKHLAKFMAKKGIVSDDEAAISAMGALVSIVRDADLNMPPHVLKAAEIILQYTKQKPAAKNEVTVAKAEDYLNALVLESAQHDMAEIRKEPVTYITDDSGTT